MGVLATNTFSLVATSRRGTTAEKLLVATWFLVDANLKMYVNKS